jgi:hypothetical protein
MEVLSVQKRPQVKEGLEIHTHFFAETGNSKVCLSANKDTTWVIDSGATDHLVKEDTYVINKYKLSVPTKIHIAKNNNYLLTYVNGEVRNIRIPDVFLVEDLTYNSLPASKLEKKGFVITIKMVERG